MSCENSSNDHPNQEGRARAGEPDAGGRLGAARRVTRRTYAITRTSSAEARRSIRWRTTPPRGLTMNTQIDPSRILQLGEGFMASKTLLSAVELGLFTRLGGTALTGAQLAAELGLHPRAIPDFPDTLVALGLLDRDGDGPEAGYRNTAQTAAFLDRTSPSYVGAVLEMCNARLYRFWGDLTAGLRTGQPQNEIKHTGQSMFDELYR